jgi:cell wall-associated NlpC family hydrolase
VIALIPEPGDFCCVSVGGEGGQLIGTAERLKGDGFSAYQHAFVYLGGGQRVEAESAGARLATMPVRDGAPVVSNKLVSWSTGAVLLHPGERAAICAAARKYIGVPYSPLDYYAQAAHHLHVPDLPVWPGKGGLVSLKAYIGASGHMICSQLVDQCYADAGVHLFADGRWPGYVDPGDLAGVVASRPGWNLIRAVIE